MGEKLLGQLISDLFVVSVGTVLTPQTLRRFLLRSEEVRGIREALRQGAITEETLRGFIASLLADFRVGRRFEHELALAALAVVVERRPTDFAEEFLLDLAKLKLAEMPLCIRVARGCLKHRVTVAENTRKTFQPRNWPGRLCFRQVTPDWLHAPVSVPTINRLIDMRSTMPKLEYFLVSESDFR